MKKNRRFDFSGWNFKEFAKGRKRLLVGFIGLIATFLITNKPEWAVVVGALSEGVFSLIEYYVKGQ